MIQGETNTEANYRDIYLDSSSSLKEFCLDRRKYFKKYISGEDVQDKDTQASIMGRIVETLLLEPYLFDDRFYMSACAVAPTEKMLDFVEALYECNMEATNEFGELTKSFEEMSRDAHGRSGFKLPYETVMKKFIGSDAEIYYNEIRAARSRNLTVVTPRDVENAERIVEELKTNFVTKDLINLISSDRWEVIHQLQVEGFLVEGHLCKGMMDEQNYN